ncbi:MAG: AtpZ/AtpI family protein [Candidatus Tectimicrobiota bacterium]
MPQADGQTPQRPTGQEIIRTVGKYLDLGVTFVVAIGGGAFGGYWLDARWGTAPWLLLAGALLGIVVGFYHFFSVVLRK